jgi:hypothetical protein
MAKKRDLRLIRIPLAQLAGVAVVAFLAYRRHRNNHWAADVRRSYLPGGIGLADGSFLSLKAEHKTHAVVTIAATLVFIGIICSADKFNVRIRYERWVQRGIPPSPLATSTH